MSADPPADATAPTRPSLPSDTPASGARGREERAAIVDDFAGTARFEKRRRLGVGGMGVVHEVYDRERGLRLALKGLQELGSRHVLRLKEEFRTLRDLSHPNLVRLGELIEDGGRWYFTMELVEGRDLLDWVAGGAPAGPQGSDPTLSLRGPGLKRGGGAAAPAGDPEAPAAAAVRTFDEARLRDALGQLAGALVFLHQAGKVHRDVKPSNVMVTHEGRVVLLDFGIAAAAEDAGRPSGKAVGTAQYMAPEQAKGEGVGPAADWYAFGVILYQALTGRLPFAGGSAADVLARKSLLEAPRASLGVDGLPEDLERLSARLLAQDPRERPGPAEIFAALGVPATPAWVAASTLVAPARVAFVGRGEELAELEAALEAVRGGAGVTCVLEGPSGVGKTALAEELARRAADGDSRVLVLHGRCHERESVPYKAFDGVIDGLARFLGGLGARKQARVLPDSVAPLFRVFPALEAALPARGETPPPERTAGDGLLPELRRRGFAGLRELLGKIAATRPVVLIIDDVQWADLDSLELLEALAQPAGPPPLLLLLGARRADGEAECAAIARLGGDVRRLRLGGLGRGEALTLAQALAARHPGLDAAAVAEIIDDAGGHPLFIDELLRHAAGQGAGRRAHLDDALGERVARLPAATRGVLELVVSSGAPVAHEVVALASGLGPEGYARELDELRAGRLLRIAGMRRRDTVEPFHDRVREAIYARLDPEVRRAHHAALARELEAAGAPSELLAAHHEKAGALAAAARHAEHAALAAAAALAFDRAATHYRATLDWGAHAPPRRRALYAALGDMLASAGRSRDAAQAYEDAARTGDPAPAERVELRRRATEQWVMGGHLREGLDASRAVLEHFGEVFPTSRAGALARFVWARARLDLRRLRWRSTPARELDAATLARLDMFWSVGAGLMMLDTVRGALFTTRGTLEALAAGHDDNVARFLCATAMADGATGKAGHVDRVAAACARAAESARSGESRFYAHVARYARSFFLDNEWQRVVDGMIEAERLWRAATGRSEGWEADVIEQLSCWSLENLGALGEIRARVPARIRAAERAGNRFIAVNFRTFFVHVHLVPDRVDEARRDVEDAIASWLPGSEVFGNQDYLAQRSRTYLALYAGDVEARAAALEEGWRRFFGSLMRQLQFLRHDALFLTAGLALARAAAAKARGQGSQARSLLAEARARRARLAKIPIPMAADYVTLLAPGLAAVEGDEGRAVTLLRAALARSEARGTRLHAACLRRRLGELVGGDEGAALRAASDAWMSAELVANPARLTAATLPGWAHPG